MKYIFILSLFASIACCINTQADELPINPYEDAKVGEWVKYKIQGGIESKQSIKAVTDTEVTFTTETIMNGSTLNSMDTNVPRKTEGSTSAAAEQAGVKISISEGTVDVKGEKFDCYIVKGTANGINTETYIAKDIPVSGVVKVISAGSTVMELVDYGS